MLQTLADAECVNQAASLLQSDLTIQGALGLLWTCHSLKIMAPELWSASGLLYISEPYSHLISSQHLL